MLGELLSRDAAMNIAHDDIAPASVIKRQEGAYPYARLYFRPRNPTQYSIEGIRSNNDFFNNDAGAHAPVLIMFVFRAESILTLRETHFSNGNMQNALARHSDSEEFFRQIPFVDVYHDDYHNKGDREIVFAKCAEVLAPSPLDLSKHLFAVLCRSEAERRTLIQLTPNLNENLKNKIRTVSEFGIFFNNYSFVKEVDVSASGISLQFNPRKDGKDITISVHVIEHSSNNIIYLIEDAVISPSTKWKINTTLNQGVYEIKIHLDGHLAYCALSTLSDLPF